MLQWCCLAALQAAHAAIPEHLVTSVPTFGDDEIPFKFYSGYLTVSGPFEQNPYSKVKVRYELQTSQTNASDPLVSWHQGGPGWSSVFGSWGEMGYFQLNAAGGSNYVNEYSWNQRAHMLYIEGPVGSEHPLGFGTCFNRTIGGEDVPAFPCAWNDTSQAEMYTHTLLEFYRHYPELKPNDYYISGESYGGRFIPNIAHYILTTGADIPLKGVAIGNGVCNCAGEHCFDTDHSVQLFKLLYGHGMISTGTFQDIYVKCGYQQIYAGGDGSSNCSLGVPCSNYSMMHSSACKQAVAQAKTEHGLFNVVNVYDNCPPFKQQEIATFYERTGLTPVSLASLLHENLHDLKTIKEELVTKAGGFSWSCEEESLYPVFMSRPDVQRALHLEPPTADPRPNSSHHVNTFQYHISGPDSFTLYPSLVKRIRVLIYSGDIDACVPNLGSQMWTSALGKQGVLNLTQPWHPWFDSTGATNFPLGYATNYEPIGHPDNDFTFLTVRMAGHMVPNTQPRAALEFFNHFLHNSTRF